NTTLYHYPDGEESLPARITDALGGVARLEWDGRGLLTRYTDCSGSVTAYDYDIFGQLTGRTDAEGNVTRYRRDTAGRLQTLQHADGSEEHFVWNERGQLARHQDPSGSETQWRYNLLGQPVSVTDRINRTRHYHYGPRGWLTRLENGNGGEYQFSYDAAGRITAERRPDNTDHLYRYGADGQLAEHRETGPQNSLAPPAHRLHRFRFDEAGRLAWRGNDSAEWQYHYDAAGRLTRLVRTPTAAGAELGIEADSVELQYDKAGHLLCERGVNGAPVYSRDALGNLQALTLPQGDRLQWLHYGSGHAGALKFNRQAV
ncbi:type IV secretion protein Rhs, partial [Erwinia amylovora]